MLVAKQHQPRNLVLWALAPWAALGPPCQVCKAGDAGEPSDALLAQAAMGEGFWELL